MRHFHALAKIFLAIFLFLLIPSVSPSVPIHSLQVKAAAGGSGTNWLWRDYGTEVTNTMKSGQVSGGSWITQAGYWQALSISCAILPIYGPNNCSDDPTLFKQMTQRSAISNIAQAINILYTNQPANFGLWLPDTGTSLGFIPKQAFAQGVGFNGLSPLLGVWKAMRNISYVLLALAMVVVGFMVMFRKKIDPKTVVTVQNALPRIVIALILITFSYAIVGLLIDVMYIAIAFINGVVKSGFGNASPLSDINLVSGGFRDLWHAVFVPVENLNQPANTSVDFQQTVDALTGSVTLNFSDLAFIFQLLVAIFYLVAFIRILFLLLGSYTQILLALIVGPIQILLDVFPGTNGFISWMRNIIANLTVWPITIFLLILGGLIGRNFSGNTLWVPPLLPQAGVVGGIGELIISLGIVWSIPSIVGNIKESVKGKEGVSLLGGGGGGPGAAGGGIMQLISATYYLKSLAPQSITGRIFGKPGGGQE